MSAKPIDLSILKEGLEFATFKDFRIRDGISKVIHELQSDLEDVGFEPAPQTIDAIKELEEIYLSVQTDHVRRRKDDKIPLVSLDEVIESRRADDMLEEDSDVIEERPKSIIHFGELKK